MEEVGADLLEAADDGALVAAEAEEAEEGAATGPSVGPEEG